jgi:hypothetical protein
VEPFGAVELRVLAERVVDLRAADFAAERAAGLAAAGFFAAVPELAAERAAGLAAGFLAAVPELAARRAAGFLAAVPGLAALRAVAVLRAAAALRGVAAEPGLEAPNFDCGEAARLAAVAGAELRAGLVFFSSAPIRSPSCSIWPRRPLISSTMSTSSSSLRTRAAALVTSSTTVSRRLSAELLPPAFFLPFFFLSAMVARLYSRVASPIHLRPHAPVAERVLLPGDPGRALRLAQALTEQPRMLNHHRGLWGYTGMAADGAPLTVQATGLGGPSAAIVVEELLMLGARRLIRVGSCRALAAGLGLGDVVRADAVVGTDGASRALGAAAPDPGLTAALAVPGVTVASGDLFYGEPGAGDVADLSSAAVLAAAARGDAPAAVVLAVAQAGGERIGDEALHAAELRCGEVALAALG